MAVMRRIALQRQAHPDILIVLPVIARRILPGRERSLQQVPLWKVTSALPTKLTPGFVPGVFSFGKAGHCEACEARRSNLHPMRIASPPYASRACPARLAHI